MNSIVEIQDYVSRYDEPDDALFDLQLLVSMREGKFEPGRLGFAILECYKELVNSHEVLGNWDFPEETEKLTLNELVWRLSS